MLTLEFAEKAQRAVSFVSRALASPEETVEREDMGDLHAALAPHMRNYAIHARGRQVAMVAAVGSLNYNCVTLESDLDMKAVYMPSFADMYFNSFPKFSFVTEHFDCELHPVHHFRQHALKGNINFFEPLFSEASIILPDFYAVWHALRKLAKMNVAQTCLASFFTAEQMNKGTMYTNPAEAWGYKKASHAIRILAFIIKLLEEGEIVLEVPEVFRPVVMGLKNNETGWAEYNALYTELHDTVRGMVFSRFESGSDFTFSNRVLELDGRNNEEWDYLNKNVDKEIMRLIWEEGERCRSAFSDG